MFSIEKMGESAKKAAYEMAKASSKQKNKTLEAIAKGIQKHKKKIIHANNKDIYAAEKAGLDNTLIDRLTLEGKLESIISDIEQVIVLPDPIGEQFDEKVLPNGLEVVKKRTPIGVIGVIYESRPNVTIDVSALAIKTSNCAILRGGSETLLTNQTLIQIIQEALKSEELPLDAIQLIPSVDREYVNSLLTLDKYVDMIIPRGGALLHKFCKENSTIPVITGGIGICHLFVDSSADLDRSLEVIINAKTQRPTVCNALDTLLIHEQVAQEFLPKLIKTLESFGVEIHLDAKSLKLITKKEKSKAQLAQEQDWDTEWLSLVLGVKTVEGLEEALQHIRQHSSGHSDGILTQNNKNALRFTKEVDSAAVYVNASTRFTDGSQLGLGAEVAISTQKLHARGPMGLKELTTYKWVIKGDYTVRT